MTKPRDDREVMWPRFEARKRKRERRTAATPTTPPQGVRNSTRPTPPFGGAVQVLTSYMAPFGAEVVVLWEAVLGANAPSRLKRGGNQPASGMSRTSPRETGLLWPTRPEPKRLYPACPSESIPSPQAGAVSIAPGGGKTCVPTTAPRLLGALIAKENPPSPAGGAAGEDGPREISIRTSGDRRAETRGGGPRLRTLLQRACSNQLMFGSTNRRFTH